MVNEYWQGADSPGAAYEYVVSWVMTNTPDYREGRWQVTSVTADEGLPARAVQ
jgi:hypothetical protein